MKTYSHLAREKRTPTEYEIVTSQLLYYVKRGFEITVPLQDWYQKYQSGSLLRCSDWDSFRDPRETTYAKYTALQSTKEAHVDGLLQSLEDSDYDRRLSNSSLDLLASVVMPLRYPLHGLQMVAAYVGQMAPSGRITIAALLQAADEMRRVQRLAYRMAQLRLVHPGFAESSREIWLKEPPWQPLRQFVERLLITYDWGEAFAVLNLCLKPLLDQFFMVELPSFAKARGDYLLGEIFYSFHEDSLWHREWTRAMVTLAVRDRPENQSVLKQWVNRSFPAATETVTALRSLLGEEGRMAAKRSIEQVEQMLLELGVRT